jgi:hypothetical protein
MNRETKIKPALRNTSPQLKSVRILVIMGCNGTWSRELISAVKVTISPTAGVRVLTLSGGTFNVIPFGLMDCHNYFKTY